LTGCLPQYDGEIVNPMAQGLSRALWLTIQT
jgi:hypothetical protein